MRSSGVDNTPHVSMYLTAIYYTVCPQHHRSWDWRKTLVDTQKTAVLPLGVT